MTVKKTTLEAGEKIRWGRTGFNPCCTGRDSAAFAQNVEEDRRDDERKRGVEQAARRLGKHRRLNRGRIDVRGSEACSLMLET